MVQLRMEQVIVVMDQAVYAKATEIAWKHTSIHANAVGISHTIVNALASNGKSYQYVGMRDIYIVPGIIAGVQYPAYHMEECTIEG